MISCFLVITFLDLNACFTRVPRSKEKWLFSTNLTKSATPQLQVIFAQSLVGRSSKCGDAETYVQHRREKINKKQSKYLQFHPFNGSFFPLFLDLFCFVSFILDKNIQISSKNTLLFVLRRFWLIPEFRHVTCLSAAFTKGKIHFTSLLCFFF